MYTDLVKVQLLYVVPIHYAWQELYNLFSNTLYLRINKRKWYTNVAFNWYKNDTAKMNFLIISTRVETYGRTFDTLLNWIVY